MFYYFLLYDQWGCLTFVRHADPSALGAANPLRGLQPPEAAASASRTLFRRGTSARDSGVGRDGHNFRSGYDDGRGDMGRKRDGSGDHGSRDHEFRDNGSETEDYENLMRGLLFSLKRFCQKIFPKDSGGALLRGRPSFETCTTNFFKLHFYESLSGFKFVLLTTPECPSMVPRLKQIYLNVFVPKVTQLPTYTPTIVKSEDYKNAVAIRKSLEQGKWITAFMSPVDGDSA